MTWISTNFREFMKAAIFGITSILMTIKIVVFSFKEQKILDLVNQLQNLEKYDEANRIANCNEYVLSFLKLSLLIIGIGDVVVYLDVGIFGRSEYKLALPWLFDIDNDIVYYISYGIQVIQAFVLVSVYVSIETLPFGLMILLKAHLENVGLKVSSIGWNTENPSASKEEDKTITNSWNNKQEKEHNEFYQEDGAMPSTSTGISTMSRDYMKNPWNSRGKWGSSPEISDNSDSSDDEDTNDEGCKDNIDLALKRRIIYDEFIKPRNSFVRHFGVCLRTPFGMPTKPIKSQKQATDNKPTTSMEDLLKHCIDYQVQIFKYT